MPEGFRQIVIMHRHSALEAFLKSIQICVHFLTHFLDGGSSQTIKALFWFCFRHLLNAADDVVSEDAESADCYYPSHFTLKKEPHQTLVLIEENRVYLEEWVEEGWDDENDRATEDYRFYTKLVVKDLLGNEISRETGSVFQSPDGSYWIS